MSRELEIKSIRMKEYKDIYSEVEAIVRDLSGGNTIHSYRDLQRSAKELLCLRTQRADWRTKQGIILWFCEHWKLINEKFIKEIINCDLACSAKHENFPNPQLVARVSSEPEVCTNDIVNDIVNDTKKCITVAVKKGNPRFAKLDKEAVVVDETNDVDLYNEMFSDLNYYDFDQADCEVEDVDF